jgi:hypothetical protein
MVTHQVWLSPRILLNAASLTRALCRTWLDSPALQKSGLWDQSGGARWKSIRTTVVWMAGRHRRA